MNQQERQQYERYRRSIIDLMDNEVWKQFDTRIQLLEHELYDRMIQEVDPVSIARLNGMLKAYRDVRLWPIRERAVTVGLLTNDDEA
jgi:hypothetical protein